MTELERELAHAVAMAGAAHRPDCMQRRKPWTKLEPTCGVEACVTDADRRLWEQLAAGYRAQLDRHRQETLL